MAMAWGRAVLVPICILRVAARSGSQRVSAVPVGPVTHDSDGNMRMEKADPVNAVTEKVWGGFDFHDDVLSFDNLAMPAPGQTLDMEAERNVHVFGLQNSGTDLLLSMLYINFGPRLKYYDSSFSNDTHHETGLWRYADLKEQFRREPQAFYKMQQDNVHAIIVLREPLSWMLSLKKAPREFYKCMGEEWLTQPCMHNKPAGPDSSVPGYQFPSLSSVWNHWSGELNQPNAFGFRKSIVITYESLVRNPSGALSRISSFLGIDPPAWEISPDNPDGHGQEFATKQLNTRSFMSSFSREDRMQACARLDSSLMQQYAYDSCSRQDDDYVQQDLPITPNVFHASAQSQEPELEEPPEEETMDALAEATSDYAAGL